MGSLSGGRELLRYLAASLSVLAFSGCASNLVQQISLTPRVEVVADRSYRLGEPRHAFVGDAVVRVKRYTQTTTDFTALKANEAVTVHILSAVHVSVAKGQELPVVGERYIDGRRHFIVTNPRNGYLLQIDEGGRIYPKILNGPNVEWAWQQEITPPWATFTPVGRTSTAMGPADENYEIIFNGIDGQSMRFQYREYTPDDLARPSYFQELTYPLSSKSIRFKQLSIAVQEVNAESISYSVTSDGRS